MVTRKTNTEAEVQSMVTVPIHQDTSSVPLMTTPVIDITDPQSDSTTVPASMPTTIATVTETTTATTVPPPPPQPQRNKIHQLETQDLSRLIREQTVEFIDSQEIDRKIKESVKEEILLQRMLEENYDKGHEGHKMAYEALQKSIIRDESEKFDANKAEERTKKKSKQDSPKIPPGSPPSPPPPPPPSGASGASGTIGASDSSQDPPPPPPSLTTNRGDQSQSSAAPGSSKTTASTEYAAWTTTTSRLKPAASSVPKDVLMHKESDFEAQDKGSNDEDSGSRHIPKVSLHQEWFKPLSEEEKPATPEPTWSIPSSSLPVPNNNWASALASSFKKNKQDSPKTPPGSPPSPHPPPPPSGASGASGTIGASDSAQNPPPSPPSLTTNRGDQSQSSAAPGSSKTTASTEYTAWTTTTSRLKPAASSVPEDVLMHEESDFEAQDKGSDDEDSDSRHIPKVSLHQEWFKPLSEEERPATPEPAWSIPSSSLHVPNNNWASALASSFVPPPENSLLSQTGDIGVFIDWFCKKQGILELTPEHLEVDEGLLRYNVSRPLSLGGPPGQVMIQTEFFFNKDLEYLRFGHKGDRLALSITKMKDASYPDAGIQQMVPDQMWIEEECMYDISATYGISHWSPEPPTAKGQEDSLYYCQLMDQESGSYMAEFMHDYKILDSPRAVLFRDKYGMHMLMRFNEIHKFSDDTLQQIDEALDYWVKEFKVNKNNQSYKDGKVRYEFPRSRQSQRDLPRDNSLVSVEVLRNRVNTYAVRITWLIADMEDKYHGPSDTLHNPP
ncbi:hypothetical protein Tco_0899994 [Tanacetum coccineum]